MPKIAYVDKDFRDSSWEVIDQANVIIAEYSAQGFNLTLRQLYYQFVARGLAPNNVKSYNRIGKIVNEGRLAGHIDWYAIVDRTRNRVTHPSWSSPQEILRSAANSYREDIWASQGVHAEVWIEKDALIGVIEPACRALRVPYFACRGYVSQSELWRAGRQFQRLNDAGKRIVVIHLGDHDPSGIDMTRDMDERLATFSEIFGRDLHLERIALNYDQVQQYSPPPNPAKLSDSRAAGYIDNYGYESWELDALEPAVLDRLIRETVEGLIDWTAWNEALEHEEHEREALRSLADEYTSQA